MRYEIKNVLLLTAYCLLFTAYCPLSASPWQVYKEAKRAYTQGEFELAKKKFDKLRKGCKNIEIMPYAIYYSGKLEENPKMAVSLYKTIVDSYPDSKVADNALYRIAQYYYATNDYKKSTNYLKILIEKYPQSDCIKEANKWLKIMGSKGERPFALTFSIQVGAFLKQENAINLKEKLTKQGLKTFIVSNKYHKVRVGNFSTREEAELFKNKHNIQGFVVKQ